MKFHAFSPRAAATAVGMALLLAGTAATGASGAVTSTPAPVVPQVVTTTTQPAQPDTATPPGAPTGLTATPGNGTVTPDGTPATPVTPAPHTAPAPAGPASPAGLTAQPRRGEVVLSWSPPPGGLKTGEGYLIYMATSPGHEGAKPSVPHQGHGYAPVPTPRRPHDDQPVRPSSRIEELNGPRYR